MMKKRSFLTGSLKFRVKILWLLNLLLWSFPHFSLWGAPHFFIKAYRGKYFDNPAFKQIQDQLSRDIPQAVQHMEEALGIPFSEQFYSEIKFEDTLVPEPPFSGRIRAKRHTKRIGGRLIHTISINLEFLFQGEASLLEEILHELNHAQILEFLSPEIYKTCPRWFREGIALKFSGQGPARFQSIVASVSDPAKIFNGLEDNPQAGHFLSDYAENYQALQFMEEKFGQKALLNFLKSLKKGTPFLEVFPKVLMCPFEEFNRMFRVYFEARLPVRIPKGSYRKLIGELFEEYKRGNYLKVISKGEGFFSVPMPEDQKGALSLLLARSHFRVDHYRKSLFYIDSLQPSPLSLWGEIEILRGKNYWKLGLFEEALHFFKTLKTNSLAGRIDLSPENARLLDSCIQGVFLDRRGSFPG